MPRTTTLGEMTTNARRLADQENATDRFPDSEIKSYINSGIAELWDILIAVRGWQWCGKTWLEMGDVTQSGSGPQVNFVGSPVSDYQFVIEIMTSGDPGTATFRWSLNGGSTYSDELTMTSTEMGNTGITVQFVGTGYVAGETYQASSGGISTIRNQQLYDLPDDFYKLYSIIATTNGASPYPIEELGRLDESYWRDTNAVPLGNPMYYQIQAPRGPVNPVAGLRLFPVPDGGQTLRVNYFPAAPELTSSGDVFDGINGWEDYVEMFAARQMALKDEALELAAAIAVDMKSMENRIRGLVGNRTNDPPRIQNARRNVAVRRFPYWRL